jgi:alcohol dehydrogenase (cytochrome c)
VYQTWTAGIDANGRPLPLPHGERRPEGTEIHPGNQGGTNWWPPSYDADLGLIFVPAIEQGMVFFPSAMSTPRDTGKPFYTAIRALNAATGELLWEYRGEPRNDHPEIGGLLSTRSGLLFGGDAGRFFAFESKTGRQLWSVHTGGTMGAPPVAYAVNGVQYIAVATGRDLMAFALPQPTLTVQSAASRH